MQHVLPPLILFGSELNFLLSPAAHTSLRFAYHHMWFHFSHFQWSYGEVTVAFVASSCIPRLQTTSHFHLHTSTLALSNANISNTIPGSFTQFGEATE
ncbi:hypothetical protein SCLCIDRAFT_968148 [Scleroderma citrinum Foug A]|uniref:Uncharacterized protein n=1 Tax=Scleroderma citrinum Foug A TaxID=1036808 RepID=A0A0C3A6A7_9AGAM|nr:hypothetical protein SCLCIDRAFT_968148 [Scleroderma citrinum Foug A]